MFLLISQQIAISAPYILCWESLYLALKTNFTPFTPIDIYLPDILKWKSLAQKATTFQRMWANSQVSMLYILDCDLIRFLYLTQMFSLSLFVYIVI